MENKAKKGCKGLPKNKGESISLAPLEFEDALSALLQIKPVNNAELKKDVPKKKSKPKTEK